MLSTRLTSFKLHTPLSSLFHLSSSLTTHPHPSNPPKSKPVNNSDSTISSTQPLTHKPRTPLFLKPPIHTTALSSLNTFFNWAKTHILSIGPTFLNLDNGPDSAHLLKELNWFISDAIEDTSVIPHLGSPQKDEKMVGLRVSLDEMYELWGKRVNERVPFQYIVGCEYWGDLVLCVEPGVLIPRPETVKIVEVVAEVVEEGGDGDGVWADLGTGSGAVAMGVARILKGKGKVVATDLSPVAVAVARFNVERYGLQDVIEVKQGSWFEPLVGLEGQLAGVVSNPPYIPSEDIGGLQAEVGKHEPLLALDGGKDGMDSLFHLCSRMSVMLKAGGFFIFETNGEKQCKILADYLQNATGSSFYDVTIIPDFADIPRFVTGRRV